MREVRADGEVGQAAKRFNVPSRGEQLKVAEPRERRSDAADDRTWFGPGVAVVEHVANHLLASQHQAQGARGRHTQMVHRLTAQELADGRSQNCQPVSATGVRRRARTLEL